VYFAVLLFALAILAKLLFVQVKERSVWLEKAQTQEIREFKLEASRGNVFDAKGNLLATSIPIFEIRFDASSPLISDKLFYDKIDSLSYGISKIFGKKSKARVKKNIVKARRAGNRYFLIERRATFQQLKKLRELPIFRLGKFKGGLITNRITKRERPYSELAARTIGYENTKEDLHVGIEGAYSEYLTGKPGKQLRRRINHGDWIPIFDDNEVEPKNGLDIITTIDVNIQDIAENALLRQLLEHKAFQGCAVVMEVETGHIKAIANLRFDSADGKYKETYNYAIGESIEPGSTFKLPSILTALDDEKVKLTDSLVTGSGYKTYYGRTVRDTHKIGNGRITVRDAFEHSSNVGLSIIITEAYGDKPSDYIDKLYSMSLNKPLGLKIQGEGIPYIKHPSNKKTWYGTSLPWMSYGYELQITPLQTLAFYNAIANDGVMVKPQFVSAIHCDGLLVEEFETEIINKQVVSEKTVLLARSLLEGVVERGTGRLTFAKTPYKVAGKTGTAQIAVGGKYNKTNYNASFVGYFPANNPKYSCIVVVNNPSSGKYYGGSVAGPAFREISDKIYSTYLALEMNDDTLDHFVELKYQPTIYWHDDIKTIYDFLNIKTEDYVHEEDWATTKIENGLASIDAALINKTVVPDVRSLKARDAVFMLENMGMKVSLFGKGTVKSQSVRPGTKLTKGRKIKLMLSTY
jgi:cell division protein FtsI (penicillin-binding protein 3)